MKITRVRNGLHNASISRVGFIQLLSRPYFVSSTFYYITIFYPASFCGGTATDEAMTINPGRKLNSPSQRLSEPEVI
jgi:hypothetical protein